MTNSAIQTARAIVAGHGKFASGLLTAVAQITGRDDAFIALSNAGLGALDLERVIREHVDRDGVEIIFTDLPAGSCTIAARRVIRERPHIVLVTGANLAALLDYALHGGRGASEAAKHASERAREAIGIFGGGSGAAGGGPAGSGPARGTPR